MTEEMTIEQMDDEQGYADYVAQMTYETRKYTVRCDICDATAYDSEKQLKADGWLLSAREEICWRHE